MQLITTVLAFLVTLGVLITIHEFGHYWVARRLGVKILRFSLGFGRPLLKVVRGADKTEWVIAALPLGGYVRMLDERDAPMPLSASEAARAFNRQSVARRTAIVLAGPMANFLLAVLVYWGLNVFGSQEPRAVIAQPAEQTPAARSGLKEGDVIVAVDDVGVQSWNDLRWTLLERLGRGDSLQLLAQSIDGEQRRLTLDLAGVATKEIDQAVFERIGLLAGAGAPVIHALVPDGAAQRAGLKVGDRILLISGEAVRTAREASVRVRASAGQVVLLRVERDGQQRDIEVIPTETAENGARIGRIGVDFRDLVLVRYDPVQGLVRAVGRVWETSVFSLQMLGRMVTGEASWKNLSGPVTIADYAGQTARTGWVSWLSFLALVSISLGVLNLLPIPMLDGGHLLYYAVESLRGGPPPERWIEFGQRFGFAFLILLTVLALYNDVTRLLP